MNNRWPWVLLVMVLLAGCSRLQERVAPTAAPTEAITVVSVSIVSPTAQPDAPTATGPAAPSPTFTLSPSPSLSPTPSETRTPTRSPTITRTPTATRYPTRTRTPTPTPGIPFAAIQILNLGPMSKVVSPLSVNATVKVGSSKTAVVTLLGEDGRLLERKVVRFAVDTDQRAPLTIDLEYEISAVAETGRLSISTDDAEGRPVAQTAVDLILLSVGEADINPPSQDFQESLIIQEPAPKELIQGGKAIVSGQIRFLGSGVLQVQMIAMDGKIVGSGQAVLALPAEGGYVPFKVEATYSVSKSTWVRLIVQEIGTRIPTVVQLSSVEVLLGP